MDKQVYASPTTNKHMWNEQTQNPHTHTIPNEKKENKTKIQQQKQQQQQQQYSKSVQPASASNNTFHYAAVDHIHLELESPEDATKRAIYTAKRNERDTSNPRKNMREGSE